MKFDFLYSDRGSISKDNKKYYFKINNSYLEILIEKIADLYDIKHAHYESINVQGFDYYISEDLGELGLFNTAEDLGIVYNHLDYIRDTLLFLFPNNFDKLMDQVIKMYFMDLIILNMDRNIGNWGILEKNNDVDLYILDNELSLISYKSLISSCDNPKHKSIVEVENIFDNFPLKYLTVFLDMYSILNEYTLRDLIKETEEEIGMELPYKDDYLIRFVYFRDQVKKTIDKKHKELKK